MNNIGFFIKRERVLLLFLLLTLINPYFYGYRIAILFFLFIIFKSTLFINYLDKNVFFLFLFSSSYSLFEALNIDYVNNGLMSTLPNLIIPLVMYLIGLYITKNYKGNQIRIFLLFFVSLMFSIIPIISIFIQLRNSGFFGIRSLYLIWDNNFLLAATILGSYFTFNMTSIGLVNAKRNTKFEKLVFKLVVIVFVISIICILRLGNRTQIIIALISLISTFFINTKLNSFFKILFVILPIIGLSVYYLSSQITLDMDAFTFYTDRIVGENSNTDSAGGRTERWGLSLQSIITNPLGWQLNKFGYSHNLWLDVARVGGIVPLFFLLLFTVSSIKIWLKSLKRLEHDLFLKNYVFLFFISFMLIFSLEPVIEGMYLLFLVYCLFIGFLQGIVTK